jgi:hypothetical protein
MTYGKYPAGMLSLADLNTCRSYLPRHPGMVCLCGKILSNHFVSLLDDGGQPSHSANGRLPHRSALRRDLCAQHVPPYDQSLRRDTAWAAVKLYRDRFAGFLEAVRITDDDDEGLADFLTSEGVLSRPVPHERKYRVASPLIDALVRLKVIPRQFPNAPSVPPKEIRPNVLDIPVILAECLKCFDKELIRSAYSCSYKVSTVSPRFLRHSRSSRKRL